MDWEVMANWLCSSDRDSLLPLPIKAHVFSNSEQSLCRDRHESLCQIANTIAELEQAVVELSTSQHLLRSQQSRIVNIAIDNLVSYVHQLFSWLRDLHARELELAAAEQVIQPISPEQQAPLLNKFLSFLKMETSSETSETIQDQEINTPILLELCPVDFKDNPTSPQDRLALADADRRDLSLGKSQLQHRLLYVIGILKCMPLSTAALASLPAALLETGSQVDLIKALQMVG